MDLPESFASIRTTRFDFEASGGDSGGGGGCGGGQRVAVGRRPAAGGGTDGRRRRRRRRRWRRFVFGRDEAAALHRDRDDELARRLADGLARTPRVQRFRRRRRGRHHWRRTRRRLLRNKSTSVFIFQIFSGMV